MARPKKNPAMKMDADLRIPVTKDQKAIIEQAVADEPMGLAAWARNILLEEAKKKLESKR